VIGVMAVIATFPQKLSPPSLMRPKYLDVEIK
jgi:hypothetical protein